MWHTYKNDDDHDGNVDVEVHGICNDDDDDDDDDNYGNDNNDDDDDI